MIKNWMMTEAILINIKAEAIDKLQAFHILLSVGTTVVTLLCSGVP